VGHVGGLAIDAALVLLDLEGQQLGLDRRRILAGRGRGGDAALQLGDV